LRSLKRIQNNYTLKFKTKPKMIIPYGRHTYGPQPKIIGYMPWVIKLAEGTRIGNFCSIGPDVKFAFLGKHDYTHVSTYPFPAFYEKWGINKKEFIKGKIDTTKIPSKPIVIENDVWIAKNATIMEGVKVGNGSVVATESLVTKDVPPYAIVGGNPAKIIKFRFKDEQITELLNISWWNWEDKDIQKIAALLISEDIDGFLREVKGKYQSKTTHT